MVHETELTRPRPKLERWEKLAACQTEAELQEMVDGIRIFTRWNPLTPHELNIVATRRAELQKENA